MVESVPFVTEVHVIREIFAGISHKGEALFLRFPHSSERDMIYADAKEVADLYQGWRLPDRKEAALLYANLQEFFDDRWFWTSEMYHADVQCMWCEAFGYGRQADLRVTDAARVCLVRSVKLSPKLRKEIQDLNKAKGER